MSAIMLSHLIAGTVRSCVLYVPRVDIQAVADKPTTNDTGMMPSVLLLKLVLHR